MVWREVSVSEQRREFVMLASLEGANVAAMKHWLRAWKVRLIHVFNPDWNDLYEMIL